jgi:hypothetical protein
MNESQAARFGVPPDTFKRGWVKRAEIIVRVKPGAMTDERKPEALTFKLKGLSLVQYRVQSLAKLETTGF